MGRAFMVVDGGVHAFGMVVVGVVCPGFLRRSNSIILLLHYCYTI